MRSKGKGAVSGPGSLIKINRPASMLTKWKTGQMNQERLLGGGDPKLHVSHRRGLWGLEVRLALYWKPALGAVTATWNLPSTQPHSVPLSG